MIKVLIEHNSEGRFMCDLVVYADYKSGEPRDDGTVLGPREIGEFEVHPFQRLVIEECRFQVDPRQRTLF